MIPVHTREDTIRIFCLAGGAAKLWRQHEQTPLSQQTAQDKKTSIHPLSCHKTSLPSQGNSISMKSRGCILRLAISLMVTAIAMVDSFQVTLPRVKCCDLATDGRFQNGESCLQRPISSALSMASTSQISAKDLKCIQVTNSQGEKVVLGDAMSDQGVSIVIFLRHLGCSWCWSYVHQWNLLQREMADLGIEDPIFVSIGDPDRLNAFLSKNPEVSHDRFFVDGYDFAAYREAGFGRFDEKPKDVTDNVKPKPVSFGGAKGWWTFVTSFIPLAPVTPDMKFPENLTPEGLFWVGGTFVVVRDRIVYRWDDRISGDHPEANEVLATAKAASSQGLQSSFKVGRRELPDVLGFIAGIARTR